MAFFSDLQQALDALRAAFGQADVEALDVPSAVRMLADDAVVGLVEHATTLVRAGESVRIAASGVIAARSTREDGHRGLAQSRGHRSPVSLIQDLTGTTRTEATKHVRLGEALAAGIAADGLGGVGGMFGEALSGDADEAGEAGGADAEPLIGDAAAAPARPWHAVLGDALLTGRLTSAQHDAIYRGLGEPPAPAGDVDGAADGGAGGAADSDGADADGAADSAEITVAWATAAAQLIDEAAARTVEELASAARTIRDLLDPDGATRRFEERFQARGFRMWTDRDGGRHGTFDFDDEMAAWIRVIIDTALRPRRGGPRFVDPAEQARADDLIADPRSTEQLTYDLLTDLLRAGALTDTDTVFGSRQPGLRIVTTTASHRAAIAGHPAVAVLEDTDTSLPGWLLATRTCDGATTPVTLDPTGNPLDLGREQRLYTPRQRLTLAIRDGGCRWTDCDRPASYCEAHHIDPYAHGGRTDIDRGILLCRFHHMQLHHAGWRITRHNHGDFTLHPPGNTPPTPLPPRLARRYAWGDLQPPPRRFRPAA